MQLFLFKKQKHQPTKKKTKTASSGAVSTVALSVG